MSIDIKDFPKILKKSVEDAVKETTNRANMQKLATSLADDIAKRTQLGYGVTKNGAKKQKLKPLAESTKLQRAGKLTFRTGSKGQVYPIGSVTNKELKSLRGSESAKKQNKKNKAFLKANKPKLSGKTGPKRSNLTMSGKMINSIGALVTGVGRATIGFRTGKRAQVAAFVSKMRPFMFASDLEQKRLEKRVAKLLTDFVKRHLNRNFK